MEVRLSAQAAVALRRSNKSKLIRQKIGELAANPLSLSANVIRLQESAEYRLRVQDWRVIFSIEDGVMVVSAIAPRGSAYEVKR